MGCWAVATCAGGRADDPLGPFPFLLGWRGLPAAPTRAAPRDTLVCAATGMPAAGAPPCDAGEGRAADVPRAADAPAGMERCACGDALAPPEDAAPTAPTRLGDTVAATARRAEAGTVPVPAAANRQEPGRDGSTRGACTRRRPGEGVTDIIGGAGGSGATPIAGAPVTDADPPGSDAGACLRNARMAGLADSRGGVSGPVGAEALLSSALNGSGPSLAITGARTVLVPPGCVRSTAAIARAEYVGPAGPAAPTGATVSTAGGTAGGSI